MIHPDVIVWQPAHPQDDLTCPICGQHGAHTALLDVPALLPPHQLLHLARCGGCGSAFYDRQDIRDFSDLGQDRAEFWQFYVEEGAGIWETIWPLVSFPGADPRSLLDVGCGFGFTLDFWRRSGKGDASGVELAEYGRQGAAQLGVPIYAEYLEHCAALAGRTFDVVYASEVIEHVPDPRAFVALLARWVAPEGMLVLTTPNADFVRADTRSSTQLAALAPGFHAFLLSASALRDVLRGGGFDHVDVRAFGERLVGWASRRPVAIAAQVPPPAARAAYMTYLEGRVAAEDVESTALWQGMAYRCVRDLVNGGNLRTAGVVARRLRRALEARFGAHVLQPDAMIARLYAVESLAAAGEIAPFFLPCLYYLLGALAEHLDGDDRTALAYYRGSHATTLACVARQGSIFHLEAISLVWPARLAEARLLLRGRDASAAARILIQAADSSGVLDASNAYALPPEELIEQDLPRAADALADSGERALGNEVAQAYCRYVSRRYGADLCSASGIEAALSNDRPVPLDPLFPIWAAALSATAPPTALGHAGSPVQRDQLATVVRIGRIHADRLGVGRACADRAARAQRLLAPQTTRVAYDFSFTMKPPQR